MSTATILVIFIIVLLIGGAPQFGLHNSGYGPSGVLGLVLIIILILMVLGRI